MKLSKIPRWCWYVFPVAILLLLFFVLRGGGKSLWSRFSSVVPSVVPVEPVAPPAISPEVAEEAREEIRDELEEEVVVIETEADELRRRIREKFGG